MGTVSADFRSITINAGQDLGTAGSYTLTLDFNGASSATAQVSNGTISINTYVIAGIVDNRAMLQAVQQTVTMKKVEE